MGGPVPHKRETTGGGPGDSAILYRWTAVAVALVVVVAVAALAHLMVQAEARAESTTRNMAQSIELAIDGLIDSVDIALQASADDITRRMSEGRVDRASITDLLIRQQRRLPHIAYIRAMNADGDLLYGPDLPEPPVNNRDRDYFIRFRDTPDAGMMVRKPIFGHIAKRWIWSFARRIAKPEGGFGGVIIAALYTDEIRTLLEQINQGAPNSITLRDADLGLIARTRFLSNDPDPTGDSHLSLPFQQALSANPQEGSFVSGATSRDGISRIQSYRRSPKYGFLVAVGIPREAALAEWRKEAGVVSALVAAFIGAALVFARQIGLSWRRQQRDMAALEASREDLRQAQEIANLGSYTYDLVADQWTSSAILDGIFGIDEQYPRDAAHWIALVAPESRQDMAQYLNAIVAERWDFDREYPIIRHSDGQPCWVHGKGKFRLDATGAPIALVGTIQDVTWRKAAEAESLHHLAEVERSNADLEQFAYVASHDLREPLRMISSYISLLERRYADQLDQDGRDFLGFACDGALRMDRLVLDLLDFSRVARRGAPIVAMRVRPTIDQVIHDLTPVIDESGALVTLDATLDSPRVAGDAGQVARLFQNLIGNAIKYRAEGRRPEIRIGCARCGDLWEFRVADNGIGIAPQYFERVFGIFQRLHTRERYDGTGIGLAICKKIVERHGGTIWIASEPDIGSTFHFTLRDAGGE